MASPALPYLLWILLVAPPAERAPDTLPAAREPGLGPLLGSLVRELDQGGLSAARLAARRRGVDVAADGTLDVVLRLADGGVIEQRVALDRLRERLADGSVLSAHLPPPALPLRTSQGVGATGASSVHAGGILGQGTRVAVVDVGFVGLGALESLGLLPPPAKTKNYTSSPLEADSGHGTAVALIVHEMAPDAELLLVKIANLSHFKKALPWAAAHGARVLNASLGFPGANFSDGTGPAAKAVKKLRKKGVLPVVAAGNSADGHWLGPWNDPDGDSFLDFVVGDEGLTFAASQGDDVQVDLVWNDFPTSDIDVDLSVFYVGTNQNPVPPSDSTLQGASTAVQDGTLAPFESVSFTAPFTGNYAAFVNRVKKKPKKLALFVSHPVIDGTNVPASSVLTPGDAPAALTVGAVWIGQWTTGPVEDFSSRGPNLKGLAKPDLVGPDGTQSSVPGFNPFFGTSAATPHVAGAAALVLSADPDRGPDDVEQLLLAGAVPYAGDGTNLWGAGRLDLGFDFAPPLPDPPMLSAVQPTPDSLTFSVLPTSDDSPPVLFTLTPKGKAKKGQDALVDVLAAALVDDGLRPDTRYRYVLRARDSAPLSNETDGVVVEGRTLARTPPAPTLKKVKSKSAVLVLDPADNPGGVEYALFDVTDGVWVRKSGAVGAQTPVWRTLAQWGAKKTKVTGLAPATNYEFRVQARNQDGVETPLGPPLFFATPP